MFATSTTPDWDNPASEIEYQQAEDQANENYDNHVPDETVYTDNDPFNDINWSGDDEVNIFGSSNSTMTEDVFGLGDGLGGLDSSFY